MVCVDCLYGVCGLSVWSVWCVCILCILSEYSDSILCAEPGLSVPGERAVLFPP